MNLNSRMRMLLVCVAIAGFTLSGCGIGSISIEEIDRLQEEQKQENQDGEVAVEVEVGEAFSNWEDGEEERSEEKIKLKEINLNGMKADGIEKLLRTKMNENIILKFLTVDERGATSAPTGTASKDSGDCSAIIYFERGIVSEINLIVKDKKAINSWEKAQNSGFEWVGPYEFEIELGEESEEAPGAKEVAVRVIYCPWMH